MSQIKDTIKSLEGLDKRLDEIAILEGKADAAQRNAAKLRDEADARLREAKEIRSEAERWQERLNSESSAKETELVKREAAMSAAMADLERKTRETTAKLNVRENELNTRFLALEKRETTCRGQEEMLSGLDRKHRAIAEFINKQL